MITKIDLEQYVSMGGDFNKLDLSVTFSEYHDENRFISIVSLNDKGEMNQDGKSKLVHFTFSNGNTHRYALMWITTLVDVSLDKKYLS